MTAAPTAQALPRYLIQRFEAWKNNSFEENSAWFARLASSGQHPRAMVISCCDSRLDTVQMFGAEPGDLFVVRNVANLIPPYAPDHDHHGTSAAVEYAVSALGVAHIVVVGHSNCGGVEACHDMCAGDAPHLNDGSSFIGRWMDILRPGYEVIGDEPDRRTRLEMLEKESVLVSLRNLRSFPFVRSAEEEGVLTLHGAWVDIGKGEISLYHAQENRFVKAA